MQMFSVRFRNLLLWSMGLSSLFVALNSIDVISDSNSSFGIALLCGMLFFAVVQIIEFRISMFVVEERFDYFVINITAYISVIVLSLLVRPLGNLIGGLFGYAEAGNIIHTVMFGIYKFAMFSTAELGWLESTLIGHAIMLSVLFLAPLGMKGYFLNGRLGR